MILRVAMSISAYEDLLNAKGVRLDHFGLNDVALRRDDAIAAVDIIGNEFIPILGGDVYFINGGRIELAYANWYTNKNPGESIYDFCVRSIRETEVYIKNFPDYKDKTPIFSLIIRK